MDLLRSLRREEEVVGKGGEEEEMKEEPEKYDQYGNSEIAVEETPILFKQ